jgi:hypothetical protein
MENRQHEKKNESYKKMGIMILISFCIMYAVMFFNVDKGDHIYLSITRFYMSVLMVSPMVLLMLTLMKMMYKNKKLNRVIAILSVSIFILTLILLRTQTPIGDKQYMRAMIPHHSSAILTSKHADLADPEVRELSEKIIKSQEEEIAQMKAILERMDK